MIWMDMPVMKPSMTAFDMKLVIQPSRAKPGDDEHHPGGERQGRRQGDRGVLVSAGEVAHHAGRDRRHGPRRGEYEQLRTAEHGVADQGQRSCVEADLDRDAGHRGIAHRLGDQQGCRRLPRRSGRAVRNFAPVVFWQPGRNREPALQPCWAPAVQVWTVWKRALVLTLLIAFRRFKAFRKSTMVKPPSAGVPFRIVRHVVIVLKNARK